MSFAGMMLTDLDGTFLDANGKTTKENLEALEFLGKHKIVRTACTGRTLHSAREVIGYKMPFDYLIFSSGAGICAFNDDYVISHHEINSTQIMKIYEYLKKKDLDFSVHLPIPDNHKFYWFESKNPTEDLESRLFHLKDFAEKGSEDKVKQMKLATQFLAITEKGYETVEEMKKLFPSLSIIRATSPLNAKYTWIEIFPKNVSKGKAAAWLCNHLGIEQKDTMSIGNDYNDMEMLEWTNDSYVVSNAPADIVERFKTVPHHDESGFAKAAYHWIRETKAYLSIHRIITGDIGVGKTTALLKDFNNIKKQKESPHGFACKKIRVDDEVIGYDLLCLVTGATCPFIRKLAHLPEDWAEAEKIAQHFSFSKDGFNFAHRLYYEAKRQSVTHFFIDEVGHLELEDKGFAQIIADALQSNIKLTIVVRKQLIEQVLTKFSIKKYQVITINELALE